MFVRELLGGHGTVLGRDGGAGARFDSAGLVHAEQLSYKSMSYNGSGGMIRNSTRLNFHEIFIDVQRNLRQRRRRM